MQPEGVIVGGWGFVSVAYSLTAVVLLGFAWSLRSRISRVKSDEND